jgi:hypothetical protein
MLSCSRDEEEEKKEEKKSEKFISVGESSEFCLLALLSFAFVLYPLH